MKNLHPIVLLLFISTGLIASDVQQPQKKKSELAWVDEQIEAIQPARSGLKNNKINSLRNPFIFLKPVVKKPKAKRLYHPQRTQSATINRSTITKSSQQRGSLHLEAIINRSALIDEKWYQEGQNIHGYQVIKVSGNTVLLNKNNKILVLTTKTKNRYLKFNNN
ncbi:MAG: hypothetical protein FAF05_03535 [Epsilonproteobacteria bacterium]|nr:hypothetical protein [Campylobacterota bacterium]